MAKKEWWKDDEKMVKFNPKVYDPINWLKNNWKIHIVWYLEKNIRSDIFNCYFASPRTTFGHYWVVSLTNSMLISALIELQPDPNGNLIARLGRYKPQWLTSRWWSCPFDNGSKLAVGRPNNSWMPSGVWTGNILILFVIP